MSPNETIYDENKKNKMVAISDTKIEDSNESVGNPGCCKRCTDTIIGFLENLFAKTGYIVASNPVKTIAIAIVVSLLCVVGVVEYYAENQGEKLWVSSNSKGLEHQKWVGDRFPAESRIVNLIAEFDNNLLTPAVLQKLIELDNTTKNVYSGDTSGLAWNDICFRTGRGNNSNCLLSSVLIIWGYNYTVISSLDQNTIIQDINDKTKTRNLNLNMVLSDITYDNNNRVAQAKVAKMTYFLKNQEVYDKSKGRNFDEKGDKWETKFTETFKVYQANGLTIYSYTLTAFQSDSGDSISDDLRLLFVGYVLIIAYLSIMLGSFSRINQKVWLAFAGVLCIGLAIGITYGLSSAFQLFVSPVHSVLPFLLLGIGVDDVFVIVQNWDNVGGPDSRKNSVADDIALAMRHAGVSILVTSFTDVCAFLIGATTVLPALRSFCIFAGIGVLGVFILTCTLFVALLALDSRRQRSSRDACCCCIKLPDSWEAMECSKKAYLKLFMKNYYSKIILSVPGRIVVLLMTVGLLAGGSYGLSLLKQDFDPDWFLPPNAWTVKYNQANDKYFSNVGIRSSAYIGQIDYFANQKKLDDVYNALVNNKYIVNGNETVYSWYNVFHKGWLPANVNNSLLDTELRPKNKTSFYKWLGMFLNSSMGWRFESEIQRENTPQGMIIKACRIEFTHISFENAREEIEGMDSVQEDLEKISFTDGSKPFAYTRFYIGWETNKVISEELIRNLALAGVVVLLVTLFLIANIWVSLMVVSCVVFTLINIAGYMHFWGLTVDTVTTIQLILAIGLSVDYSAHIGHGFMASRRGNRAERAGEALTDIGPAVVHGGFSTFLAFIFLAGSESYVFSTFFKLFFLVVVFGCFHGLVYLPVLLSIIGPKPYASPTTVEHSQHAEMEPVSQKKNGTYHQNGVQTHTNETNERVPESPTNKGFEKDNY